MSNVYTSADQLIGKTPLLELTHIEKELGLKAKVVAKLEQPEKKIIKRLPGPSAQPKLSSW